MATDSFHHSLSAITTKLAKQHFAGIDSLREAAILELKPTLEEVRLALRSEFEELKRAPKLLRGLSKAVDNIISCLFDIAKHHLPIEKTVKISIIAAGGYGRRELYPASDIDISILHPSNDEELAGKLSSFVIYSLWDLGFTVGGTLRTIAQTLSACKDDTTICTSLLDARLIAGSKTLFEEYESQFWEQVSSSSDVEYVEAKLRERDERHKKLGDSRYVLEPNLKEGKGGLRDLHTLYWLTRYSYRISSISELVALGVLTKEELAAFMRAEQFMMEARCHLHYLAGRAEERLTFDMQRLVAEKMGYEDDKFSRAVERFMKRYFQMARTVGNLTRSVCAVLEDTKKRKPKLIANQTPQRLSAFIVESGRLIADSDTVFKDNPVNLIELFFLAQEHALDIHPRTWQLISRSLDVIDGALLKNPKANAIFLDILLSKTNPDATLRRMNESGMLGKFIPDFGHVIGQMQFDMYHVFTVDEHTINALGILHNVSTGGYAQELPLATQIFPLIKMRRALFLALLCHDISKGQGGDHSVLGETVVRKLTKRFDCTQDEIETAAWLVRHHLLMSHTAFKRDVNDPKTVQDFVTAVQSPERLRLLLVLTVADIRAVGPTIWNGWKGALLRELYYKAESMMGASDLSDELSRRRLLKEELLSELSGWSIEAVRDYLELGSSSFWASLDAPTHARIARMVKDLPNLTFPLAMDTRVDSFRAITELVICAPDQHGLFSKMSGALALSGVNIMGAKIFTLKNGIAVELFQVQDVEGKAFDKPAQLARLAVIIEQTLTDEIDLETELAKNRKPYPSRLDVFKVPPRVFIENKVSTNHTVIEVGGRDRIGFLHTVTRILSQLGLTISTAHITTYGERAVDVFYVKDVFGLKINHEGKIREIRERIIEALSQTPEKLKKTG